MIAQIWFYDGQSAARRMVEMEPVGGRFLLVEAERRHGPFAFADLDYSGEQGRTSVYKHRNIEGWRIGIAGDMAPDIAAALPGRRQYGGWIDRLGLGKAAIGFGVISAAIVAVIMLSPQWLAPLVPASAERTLGNAIVGDFGGRFCDTADGRKALMKMASGLDKNVSDIDIQVANIDMINAVALPGGKVILFKGLLTGAKSADEVAGVLAHEIGHVRERHVMQSLIRQMGLTVIMGGIDGNLGGTLNGLLSLGYTRSAEREADDHAIAALGSADISPVPTATFFDRLSAMESPEPRGKADGKTNPKQDGKKDATIGKSASVNAENLLGYMSSHPMSKNRKALFENSVVKGKNYRPVLNETEWRALQNMCANDKDVKSDKTFDFGV